MSDEFEKLVEEELKKSLADDQRKTRPSRPSQRSVSDTKNVQKDNLVKEPPPPKPSAEKASPIFVAITVAICGLLAIIAGVVVYKFVLAPAKPAATAVAPVNPPAATVNAPEESVAAAERKTTAADLVIPTTATEFRATHRIKTNDGTNLRLRNRPSVRGTQIDSLDNGSYVQVLETGEPFIDSDGNVGNWVRILTPNNKTGWCFGGYLTANASEISDLSATEFRATHRIKTNDGTNLRLRNEPSVRGTQIDSLDNGSYVQVLETGGPFVDSDGNAGNWVLIRTLNNKIGWCFGGYLAKQ